MLIYLGESLIVHRRPSLRFTLELALRKRCELSHCQYRQCDVTVDVTVAVGSPTHLRSGRQRVYDTYTSNECGGRCNHQLRRGEYDARPVF